MTRTARWSPLFLIVLVALLAAAAGCGGSDDEAGGDSAAPGAQPVQEPTEPVTITFASWVGNEVPFKKFAKKFHELHPNITVKYQNVPAEQMSQKLTTQLAGGNPPDTAYVDSSTVGDFASRGALVNLDDYIGQSKVVKRDDFVPAFNASNVFEGSNYGLPFDGESTGLFYRTDLFEQAGIDGPPKTWEEFEAAAQKLTIPEKKQYGYIVFATESAYYWYPWLWQAGGDLLSPDNKDVVFNSPEGKKAADFYVGLTKYSPKDFLNSNSYDGRIAFAQGKVAMYMAGAWFAGTLQSEFPKINGKWATAPLPEGDAGCKTTIAGDNLVVFDGSKNKDAAWLWIEFLSRPENLAEWTYKAKGSTLLPPRQSLLDSPELVETKPVLKGFADAMKCGNANTIANPKWPKIEQALNDELAKAMYGDETPEEAVDKAAEQAQELLSD
jgi:multiple sugar transport system substrate-binding protein